MSNISSHHLEKLIIWQKAVDLACEIYKVTANFPAEEKFGLTSQMRRSGVSIASNIAEGAGRGYNAQFLSIANGPSNELFPQLVISNRLGFIENINDLSIKINGIGKINASLRDKFRNNYAEEDPGEYNVADPNP